MSAVENFIALALFLFLVGDPRPGAAVPALAPGEIIWQGALNGIDATARERILELAPDGQSFLYYQGAPWPRLMLQPAGAKDVEPRMVGTVAPLATRAPRFDLEGKSVFFTARLDWRPLRPPAAGPPPEGAIVHLAAVRVAVDGKSQEKLAPAPSAPVDASAIFLDLHPGSQILLVGAVASLKAAELQNGSFSMNMLEIPASGGGSGEDLGFQIGGRAVARYSWDGKAIYYTRDDFKDGSPPLFRYDRSSGVHEALRREACSAGWSAGDVEVCRFQLAHPGGFGWDAYPAFFLQRSLKEPAVLFRLPEGFPLSAQAALVPHSIRGERMLLSSGLEDQPRAVLARWNPRAFEEELARAKASPRESLDPGNPEARKQWAAGRARLSLRAAGDSAAAPLLKSMLRSLVLLPGAPVERIKVRWAQESGLAGSDLKRAVEVIESARGAVRLEKTLPPEKPESTPPRELVVGDGQEARLTDDRNITTALPNSALQAELAQFSPYQLLLDPAALGNPGLRFQAARNPGWKEPAPASERALEFRHLDGFHGTLFLQVEGEQALPTRLVTPQLFPSEKMRRNMGIVPNDKSITFEDYRPVAGRLVPHRLRFDDGLSPFTLTVEELVFNPEVSDPIFKEN
ncbi:MAG: hypothetical protein HY717_15630 [Planctomycetes bacterium]|nr:hypothetical protein [Planctomycetota bacterium]